MSQDAEEELEQTLLSLEVSGVREGELQQLQQTWEKTGEILGPTDPTRFKVCSIVKEKHGSIL